MSFLFVWVKWLLTREESQGICTPLSGKNATPKIFDGSTLLVPMISPQMDAAVLPIIGSNVSHAYMVSGFLPVRIALPCLIGILCGPAVSVPQP